MPKVHRKRVRHFNDPGDCHELTFSCFSRLPLLSKDSWKCMFSKAIDAAMDRHSFRLAAFVYMPEHVHLLVFPLCSTAQVDGLLKAIKQPFSNRIKRSMAPDDPLLKKLTVRERPGKFSFRYWQEGGGFDRNLYSPKAVTAAMDYIHLNPVRRELVGHPAEWKWSSYHYYQAEGSINDADLPIVSPLPAEFWNS